MKGWHYCKWLIYYWPIFRLTKLAFLRVRAIPRENIFQPLVLTTFEFARAHEGGSVFQLNCTMALFQGTWLVLSLLITRLHRKRVFKTFPKTVPQCNATQHRPSPRANFKWPISTNLKVRVDSIQFLKARFQFRLPGEKPVDSRLILLASRRPSRLRRFHGQLVVVYNRRRRIILRLI